MDMIEVTIQNYLSFFPYLVGGGIVFNIWSEIDDYRNIKKIKFKNEISRYGHALSFLLELIRFVLGFSVMALGLIFVFAGSLSGDGGLNSIAAFIVIVLTMGTVGIFFNLTKLIVFDRSEHAKLLNAANKELSKTAVLMTYNEKKLIIKQKTDEYWQDLKDNFWKIEIDRTSK
jgi:hypothetical protein